VFHIDDGVMLDSIRPIPVKCAQKKWRTKSRKGDTFLGPGTSRNDKPHAQEHGLQSIKGSRGNRLLCDRDTLVGASLSEINEKHIATSECFRRLIKHIMVFSSLPVSVNSKKKYVCAWFWAWMEKISIFYIAM